jgi:hypothetical protein
MKSSTSTSASSRRPSGPPHSQPSLADILAEKAKRRLRDFVPLAWPVVEPATVFVPNWHIDAISEHLEAVSAGQIRRLIVNIPPRHMKSLMVSVFWPVWEWLEHPERRWLFASYAEALAIRDSLKCRRIIESRRYQELLAYVAATGASEAWRLTSDQNVKARFENDRTGYRMATSVGGSATGEGGDRIVIDDPHKVKEAESEAIRQGVLDWHDGTITTRFNDPKTGAEVVVMQRVHESDLTGHLLDKGGWEHLCLPASTSRRIRSSGPTIPATSRATCSGPTTSASPSSKS